ncbi:TIGR03620 family F420-dependent LLM class oxidoreductase [Streptomyces sp. NE06-03E]|uniref:TIGR03620 family F420-dependent LLM class oxidoreductase n=1 Tax=Streptomyces silvae TaxID=2803812 RepID=A0ABU7ZUY4_9ACTN|nr:MULTISPECIES: TIGR03620 family F420-dependent LLM class oxidoreductase [unclassified Streptomyces]WSS73867.1 TIGR03620 family F420-dependent LLM class oxidoreductase [Streptomyces sp. NBC_01174]MDX3054451.1 TIGR03620 family F420-dependent LLM class oxidoreductase [Streptomyces sp. NE06-03E]MDX3324066.1 TIGR03620 family F420-dependent LLM class oxidoreductase [Streptomyces sp. ME02-6979-3A]MDX3428165.1 TIGR03620 family F420-dependent LLM class oxidoreductase [Streptomyces sp. ME01-18a]MDX368
MSSKTRETFGRVGIWSSALHGSRTDDAGRRAIAEAVAELEELKYGTLWIGGSPSVEDAAAVVAATRTVTVATGILSIWDHTAEEVAAGIAAIGAGSRGRFVLGLGVSHGPMVPQYSKPYSAMVGYLDALDAATPPVGPESRVLAALGPKMLKLATGRALGAHPYLVTAEHTAEARAALGPDALLAPELSVVLDTDTDRARTTARNMLAMYLQLPNYTDNLLRLGFSESDFDGGGSTRLLDALFALGDAGRVKARTQEYLDAGADHVALQVLTAEEGGGGLPRAEWRELAKAFGDEL